jgi:drug/metabolite transporter (DMT)-like permease
MGVESLWFYGLLFTLLSALNAYFWGLLKNSSNFSGISLRSFLGLVTNIYFDLAIFTAFLASFVAYFIVKQLGIVAGRFFQVIGLVATILVGLIIFKEKLTMEQWLGIILILIGVVLVGS